MHSNAEFSRLASPGPAAKSFRNVRTPHRYPTGHISEVFNTNDGSASTQVINYAVLALGQDGHSLLMVTALPLGILKNCHILAISWRPSRGREHDVHDKS